MKRFWVALVFVLAFPAMSLAALSAPQITNEEHATYEKMMQTDVSAAKSYLDTRNYLSLCRQVVADPNSALQLTPEPDSYSDQYVTSDEQAIVDHAINLNIAAILSQKH